MIKIGHRPQRSLARSVEVPGADSSRAQVILRFSPAPAETGIVFARTDLPRSKPIPALVDSVTGTQRRTTLGRGPNQITLVEHALAALAGMRIDNCLVELDGPEPPGLDGSAAGFVEAIVEAGVVLQKASRRSGRLKNRDSSTRDGDVELPPRYGRRTSSYLSARLWSPRANRAQEHTETITSDRFRHEIAPCRTFLLERKPGNSSGKELVSI